MSELGPVHRLLFTAPMAARMDTWTATGMFTNWLEGRGPEDRQTWLVTIFDHHLARFLEVAGVLGATVEEIEGSGDNEWYRLLVGDPEGGWSGRTADTERRQDG